MGHSDICERHRIHRRTGWMRLVFRKYDPLVTRARLSAVPFAVAVPALIYFSLYWTAAAAAALYIWRIYEIHRLHMREREEIIGHDIIDDI